MKILRDRSPAFDQITPVFAITSLLIYGWTLFRVLQKIPSRLLFLNFTEILSGYAYALVFNFLESCLVVGVIIAISMLLPDRLFKDMFIARGSFVAISEVGYLIYIAIAIGQSKASQFPWEMFDWSALIVVALLFISILLPLIAFIRKGIENFADRAIALLYVLIPLSGLALIIILFNNLF